MKPPKLFRRYAGDNYRLFLIDIDGVVWASNTYWAVPVPDEKHPIARLLALYNIPLAPAVLDVGETLMVGTDPGRADRLTKFADVVRTPPDDLATLEPHSLNGAQLYGYDETHRNMLALFALPGGRYVALNDKYRRLVEDLSLTAEWHGGPDPTKPIYRLDEGKSVGIIMGVRCPATDVPVEPRPA